MKGRRRGGLATRIKWVVGVTEGKAGGEQKEQGAGGVRGGMELFAAAQEQVRAWCGEGWEDTRPEPLPSKKKGSL